MRLWITSAEVEIGRAAEAEMPRERLDEACQIDGAEKVGRAAAEVELAHFATVIEERCDRRYFAEQPLDVAAARGYITRDEPAAAAVKAGTGAEGNMNIEGQRPGRERCVAPPGALAIPRLVEIRSELRRGRIRSVARTCYVISEQQIRTTSRR